MHDKTAIQEEAELSGFFIERKELVARMMEAGFEMSYADAMAATEAMSSRATTVMQRAAFAAMQYFMEQLNDYERRKNRLN